MSRPENFEDFCSTFEREEKELANLILEIENSFVARREDPMELFYVIPSEFSTDVISFQLNEELIEVAEAKVAKIQEILIQAKNKFLDSQELVMFDNPNIGQTAKMTKLGEFFSVLATRDLNLADLNASLTKLRTTYRYEFKVLASAYSSIETELKQLPIYERILQNIQNPNIHTGNTEEEMQEFYALLGTLEDQFTFVDTNMTHEEKFISITERVRDDIERTKTAFSNTLFRIILKATNKAETLSPILMAQAENFIIAKPEFLGNLDIPFMDDFKSIWTCLERIDRVLIGHLHIALSITLQFTTENQESESEKRELKIKENFLRRVMDWLIERGRSLPNSGDLLNKSAFEFLSNSYLSRTEEKSILNPKILNQNAQIRQYFQNAESCYKKLLSKYRILLACGNIPASTHQTEMKEEIESEVAELKLEIIGILNQIFTFQAENNSLEDRKIIQEALSSLIATYSLSTEKVFRPSSAENFESTTKRQQFEIQKLDQAQDLLRLFSKFLASFAIDLEIYDRDIEFFNNERLELCIGVSDLILSLKVLEIENPEEIRNNISIIAKDIMPYLSIEKQTEVKNAINRLVSGPSSELIHLSKSEFEVKSEPKL